MPSVTPLLRLPQVGSEGGDETELRNFQVRGSPAQILVPEEPSASEQAQHRRRIGGLGRFPHRFGIVPALGVFRGESGGEKVSH